MPATLIAQFISPDQRVGAVHEHFAERSSVDGLQIVVVTLIIAVLLCGMLLLLNRIQQQKQRRQEAERSQRLRELTAPRQESMTLRQKRALPRRT